MHLQIIAASLKAVRSTGYLPSLSTLEALLSVASRGSEITRHSDIVADCATSPASASTFIKQLISGRMCKREVSPDGVSGIVLDEDGKEVLKRMNRAVFSIVNPAIKAIKASKAKNGGQK